MAMPRDMDVRVGTGGRLDGPFSRIVVLTEPHQRDRARGQHCEL